MNWTRLKLNEISRFSRVSPVIPSHWAVIQSEFPDVRTTLYSIIDSSTGKNSLPRSRFCRVTQRLGGGGGSVETRGRARKELLRERLALKQLDFLHRLIIWIILMSLTVGEKTWHHWKVRISYNSNKPVFDEEADDSSDIKAAGSWTPPPLLVDTAGVFAGTWVVPFCQKKSVQSVPNGTAPGNKGVNCDFDWWERTSPERIWKAKLSERDTKCPEENYSRCCSSTFITVRGFPQHWIILHQVCKTIAWRFDRSSSYWILQ